MSANNECGVFFGVTKSGKEYLSLCDINTLSELVDVWGDDLNVSKGLFIDENTA